MNILLVATSHDQLGNTERKTGLWLEEIAAPYYIFRDADIRVTLASPKGGPVPLDPASENEDAQTAATRRFAADPEAMRMLRNSMPLSAIVAYNYEAILIAGGHGAMWDLADNIQLNTLLYSFYQENKPIAAISHGVAGLTGVKDIYGYPMINGKRVTGFTNAEEAAVQLTRIVPFLLESRLTILGANFSKGTDFRSHIVLDNRLVTGQNPASSADVALTLRALLKPVSSYLP